MFPSASEQQVNTDNSDHSSDEEQEDISLNLQIGDIIFICRHQNLTSQKTGPIRGKTPKHGGKSSVPVTTFTLNAEGIADNKVTGILADQWLKSSQMCLFRIETPSTISASSVASKLEKKANKVSFQKSQGVILKYGQEVQLRHIHSDRFLCLDLLAAANAPGAWSVTVNEPRQGLVRQITLLPFNRSHNIGDPIKYDEPVSIVFQTDNLKYFLQSQALSPELLDINATHKPASWRFSKFERHDESSEAIKFGEVLTIKYSKMMMLMALQKPKPLSLKARSRKGTSGLGEAMRNIALTGNGTDVRLPIVTKSEIEDYSHFWVLQNAKVMIGGAVTWKSRFYIKNALTGQFLDKEMKLRPRPDPEFPFFFPRPDSFSPDSLVPSGYPLMIKCQVPDTEEMKEAKEALKKKAATDALKAGTPAKAVIFSEKNKKAMDEIDNDLVLAPDSKKSSEEALDHLVPLTGSESQWESGEVGLTLEPLGPDQRESLFELQYVDGEESIFFNLINSLFPKFIEMKGKIEEYRARSEASSRKSWEANETLERLLHTMSSAMEKISKQIRLAQGDLLESLQKIFAGLGFHAILIEIAELLHTMFDSFSIREMANETVIMASSNLLEEIWALLNDVAQENEVAAKKISEHQEHLCELLKYDTRRIGSLLTEVFRLVDPEIDDPKRFYQKWCGRLETLTKRNLAEQIIYMRIIRNLCEVGDIGLLEYQTEITKFIFKSEIAIDLVKLSLRGRAFVVSFGTKGEVQRSTAQVKEDNPDLAQYIQENAEGLATISLEDLRLVPGYVEYVQTALMMFHSICKGRCEMARVFISERLGISTTTAMLIAQNQNIHIDLRQACLVLLEALCITVPPFAPYSDQDTSFSYSDIKILEGSGLNKQPLLSFSGDNQSVQDTLRIVFEFWLSKEIPLTMMSEELIGTLHYLLSMLRVTLAVVEYKHCTELYAFMVLRAIQYLLAGFTSCAGQYMSHWGASLIARAVREGERDRKIRIIVNELLAAVLSTLVVIKQSGRRLVLMQVISKFIVEARNFSNPLFGSGLLGQEKYRTVVEELKTIVDSDRGDKMIQDFMRRIERTRKNAALGHPSLGQGTVPIEGYVPSVDFKDIVTNAPPLKEIFIRVMLEWNNFSNFLKNRMIDVMNEIFKEKRLFDKFLKTSDVLSLGPISVIYNRLKWVKENSELNSLIVRAKYECTLYGQSKSLTRIVNTLEYLTNYCHTRNGSHRFVLEKTQNIVRQLGIAKEVMLIWTLVHHLDKLGKGYDTPSIRLKSALVSFLYYFVKGNSANVRYLANMLEPTHYIMNVIQYPALLRLINDYNHLAIRDVTRLFIYILDTVVRSDRDIKMLSFFEKIMVDKSGNLKKTTQNVASTMLSEKSSIEWESLREDKTLVAMMMDQLALSAEDNSPVITQCRHLLSFSRLLQVLMSAKHPLLLSATTYFLYTVYIKKFKKSKEAKEVKMLESINDIIEPLERVISIACDRMREPMELLQFVIEGSYGLTYFTQNPAYTDIQLNLPHNNPKLLQWMFLCKGWDDHFTGVLLHLPSILETVQIDVTVEPMILRFFVAVSQCTAKLESIKEQLMGLVSLGPLLKIFNSTAGRLRALLVSLHSEIPTISEVEEYFVDRDVVAKLKLVTENSIKYDVVKATEKELEVDQVMASVMSNGYKRFTKIFQLESENEYINAIVSLIDQRLNNGMKLKKNEVKELIISLRSKIRRLQKLFTSSEQRTLFLKIMEGIVPEEENYKFKLMLNPLFKELDLVGFAITAILRHETHEEVAAALSLLYKLFIMQNREFMDDFRISLNRNSWAYPLFMKIQVELGKAKSFILEHVANASISTEEGALNKMVTHLTRIKVPEEELDIQHAILIKMLNLIQICCDNCNEPFQEFYKSQGNSEGKADVDMVTGLATFLIDIRSVKENLVSNEDSYAILDASMAALVDFVTGPCMSNQTLLGNNVRVYLMMNSLIGMCQCKKDEKLIEIHSACIQFLSTLLEGRPDPSVPETMSKFLNIGLLRVGCEDAYRRFVRGHEEELSLELDSLSEEYRCVVENSLQQAIFLIKLKSMGVVHDELNRFEAVFTDPNFSYGFYARYTGYVEVDRNGVLEGHFFAIPWKCKYITANTRNDVIVGVSRASPQEKIEDFLKKVPLCLMEMEHQQRLYYSKTFKQFTSKWAFFGRIAYYITLLINVILLYSIHKPDYSDLTENFWSYTAVTFLGVAQTATYMACFFFNLVEYYPQAVASSIPKPKEFEMDDFPKVPNSDSQAMHGFHASLLSTDKRDYATELQEKLKEVLFNFDMYYTYTYFLLSIIAVYEPIFYSFLLLDVVKQTPELINVLKSVTQNFRQLILTMWLGVIIIYLFAIGSFVFYQDYYITDMNLHCEDLWNCFFSTLNQGIRLGGDYMEVPNEEDYWSRLIFDLMFYMIIIIILLNIIFGIIIDTFAELRDERTHVLEDIRNCCYVCGSERSVIELKGLGWSYHFMREHSVFAYLSFLVYISEKKIYDCSGLEKYVKECYERQDSNFMPKTSIQMERMGEEVEIKATDDD